MSYDKKQSKCHFIHNPTGCRKKMIKTTLFRWGRLVLFQYRDSAKTAGPIVAIRDVCLSECDIRLNQDWFDTRKMSGEQPKWGECQQSQRVLPLMLQRVHVLYTHAQRTGTAQKCIIWFSLPLCARVIVKNDKINRSLISSVSKQSCRSQRAFVKGPPLQKNTCTCKLFIVLHPTISIHGVSTCHFQSFATSSFPHHGLTLCYVSKPWHIMMKGLLPHPHCTPLQQLIFTVNCAHCADTKTQQHKSPKQAERHRRCCSCTQSK